MDLNQFSEFNWPERRDSTISLKDWWDKCHDRDAPLWLTGSQGPEVWNYLQIADRIHPGATILNIGVGLGHCTRELARRGAKVHVLDISETAIEKVQDVVEGGWLASRLQELPAGRFDLAISNLVAQHMDDGALREQIPAVLRSLKADGVFALQSSFAVDPSQNDLGTPPLERMKTGGVFRSLRWYDSVVEGAGGRILWMSQIGLFPQFGSGWHAFHFARRDFPYVHASSLATEGVFPPAGARGPLQREAFLLEPDWEGTDWIEILQSHVDAFQPEEGVALFILLGDPGGGPQVTAEEAQRQILGLLRQTARANWPDISLVGNRSELGEVLGGFARVQQVPLDPDGMAALVGSPGLRLAAARQRLIDLRR